MYTIKKAARFVLNIIIVTASLPVTAQQKTKQPRFNIKGTVTGFSDSTLLFLSNLADGSYKDIDSTFIVNNRFSFTGFLTQKVEKLAVHTKDFKHRVAFWIDDTETMISAEKDKFRSATIQGAKAQRQSKILDSIISNSKNEKADYIKFIQANPASIVSANILSIYSSTWNKDTVQMLYKQLDPTAKNTIYGKQIGDFLSLNRDIKIGSSYADFEQKNLSGQSVRLSDYKGKVVLLEFWGSWCLPCRQGHPELIKTYNTYKDKGFDILGVAAETDKQIFKKAIQEDGLPWQNVSDLKGDKNKAALIYGVSYYPANFLIDRNGIIIAKDVKGDKLKEKLKEIFE
jgi:peroxiredoxin